MSCVLNYYVQQENHGVKYFLNLELRKKSPYQIRNISKNLKILKKLFSPCQSIILREVVSIAQGHNGLFALGQDEIYKVSL